MATQHSGDGMANSVEPELLILLCRSELPFRRAALAIQTWLVEIRLGDEDLRLNRYKHLIKIDSRTMPPTQYEVT